MSEREQLRERIAAEMYETSECAHFPEDDRNSWESLCEHWPDEAAEYRNGADRILALVERNAQSARENNP